MAVWTWHPGSENILSRILMSHDPSHWDAEVKAKYPDVDLMLSGHTHGGTIPVWRYPAFEMEPRAIHVQTMGGPV
ncbi:MAG: hypothetical protein IPP96_15910 [Chitinophagaceae bacterium]|nr:hypothetical protein [Chitinophagaceae bacterium]